MASTLRAYLDAHRAVKGSGQWNVTGLIRSGQDSDMGSFYIPDTEYDDFLAVVNDHLRQPNRTSSLLERHHKVGPLLVDLDMKYEAAGQLRRHFTDNHIQDFIAEYIAAMIYFSRVEDLPNDLVFYHMEKPAPEHDKEDKKHKDGVHIQCPTLTTTPKYQFALRGFLLEQDIITRVFANTGLVNEAEDCFDHRVIESNNWFLYGAGKENKASYSIKHIWKVTVKDIEEVLSGGDPVDFTDLVESVKDVMSEEHIPEDTLMLTKTLSIRRDHTEVTTLPIRPIREKEWANLQQLWGVGKARPQNQINPSPSVKREKDADDSLVVVDQEESRRVTSKATDDDIKLAFQLCRTCINATRRAGDYQDWVNVAILLKNVAGANSEEAFTVWCEVSRRATAEMKKRDATETELRDKWKLVNVDSSRRLGMGSLHKWAEEDNPPKFSSIMSENTTRWINKYAKDTHVSVASCVQEIYRQQYRCSVGQRKGAYEWYQFLKDNHAWKHMRTNTELRSHLSGRVKAEYAFAVGRLSIEAGNAALKQGDQDETTSEKNDIIAEKRKKLAAIERQLEMTTFKDHVMKECQEKFYDEEFIGRLNAITDIVGVSNGVLDLCYTNSEGGTPRVHFRAGLPDDNISFQMGRMEGLDPISYIPYDPNSQEQKDLMGFFMKIYPDPVLRKYALTLFSTCLEGTNREQKFYVMQGVGSNGKSMIEMLMETTFGDYGTSISTTIFTRLKPDSGAANPDIITTKCRRYLHCGEPDDNQKINTSIMKQWTGGDLIQARGLFSEQDKFRITGKIFMSCNDLPPVSKQDGGTWRRIRVIPHTSIFKDHGDPLIDPSKHIYEKDPELEGKLRGWRTAFLSLLVHYWETYYLPYKVLDEPECVLSASKKYKETSDLFMLFFNDNFIAASRDEFVSAKEVKSRFADWLRGQGKTCDLKLGQVLERMKDVSAGGSTDKQFFGLHGLADEEDISGAWTGTATNTLILPV